MQMTIVMKIKEILFCLVEECHTTLLLSHKNQKFKRKMKIRIINNKKLLSILKKLKHMVKKKKRRSIKVKRKRMGLRRNRKKRAIRDYKSLISLY